MAWQKTVFDGLAGYETVSGKWRMVAISQCGPRIAFLGMEENLLYWETPGVVRGEWRLRGGHRVWLTRPLADESEDTYLSDNLPCAVETDGPTLTLTAPAHAVNRLVRGMRITAGDGGRFQVTNFVRNEGDLIYSGGVWSPTCVKPEGRVMRVPLGEDDVTWDLVRLVIPRVFAGNVSRLDDPQAAFEGNDLVVRPKGHVMKRCMGAPKGIVRLECPETGVCFQKKAAYVRGGSYPMGGCNVAVFVGENNWMGELETFGVEQSIIPGQTIENTEEWELTL